MIVLAVVWMIEEENFTVTGRVDADAIAVSMLEEENFTATRLVGVDDIGHMHPYQQPSLDCSSCAEMVCTEPCRYNPVYCQPAKEIAEVLDELDSAARLRAHSLNRWDFPAPRCLWSTDDLYFDHKKKVRTEADEWERASVLFAYAQSTRREQLFIPEERDRCAKHTVQGNHQWAMWPDEREFIVKLLINLNPTTYLEWGSGGTTIFLSMLAKRAYSVEHQVGWCNTLAALPVIKCLTNTNITVEGTSARPRLTQACIQMKLADGSSANSAGDSAFGILRKVTRLTADEQTQVYLPYLQAISTFGEKHFDFVLVDGRVRVQCALLALHYLHDDSILVVHDFMIRVTQLAGILQYYTPIGRTRNIVAFKRSKVLPNGWEDAWKTFVEQ